MPAGHKVLAKHRFLAAIETAATWLSAVSLAMVALLIGAAVLLRALGLHLPDAQEFASLFMAVAVFWGMVGTVLRDELIKVDIVTVLFGSDKRRVIRWIGLLIAAGLLVALAAAGVRQLMLVLGSGEVTPELRLPLWPFLALALSGLVLTAIAALSLVWPSRKKERRHGD